MVDIDLDAYKGRKGALSAERGADGLRALHQRFGGNCSHAATFLGYSTVEGLRRKWLALGLPATAAGRKSFRGNTTDAPVPPPDSPDDYLAGQVYEYLLKHSDQPHSVDALADQFDAAPKRIETALENLRGRGYTVQVAARDSDGLRQARMSRQATATPTPIWRPGWGECVQRYGYVSDTHLGNLCACSNELEAAYEKFAEEGITTVLHTGDMNDGPGNRGFPGHSIEVRPDCQTAQQLALHAITTYPRRPGITTHFIESSKSHDGWELRASGKSIATMIADGFDFEEIGPRGLQRTHIDGRDDMHFLGYDTAILGVGPEGNTRIQLVHPDGGTAYALSYQPQKWAESLEGGTKPDVALLGHYHKLNWIRERNIQVLTGECMCWQTPFMARKRIAAHVGFFIIEVTVDTDGTVRSFLPREFPFFFGERNVFDMKGAA